MTKKSSGQIQIDQPQKSADGLQEFVQKFADAQVQEVTPSTRVVKLTWRKCQGCQCKFHNLSRTVAYDSDLKDGDVIFGIESLTDADKFE